jgi:formate dehydrogenase maturation protein FdhE
LKELGINERPLHCTDIKRETVYIKDKDVWEKDNQERSTLKQVVKKIARKNLQQLPVWQEQNPDFTKLDTPENNEFMKISLNSLGSYSKEEEEKEIDKIMKNVLKEVVVDKK